MLPGQGAGGVGATGRRRNRKKEENGGGNQKKKKRLGSRQWERGLLVAGYYYCYREEGRKRGRGGRNFLPSASCAQRTPRRGALGSGLSTQREREREEKNSERMAEKDGRRRE